METARPRPVDLGILRLGFETDGSTSATMPERMERERENLKLYSHTQ